MRFTLLFVVLAFHLSASAQNLIFAKPPTDPAITEALKNIRKELDPAKDLSPVFLREETCAQALDTASLASASGGIAELLERKVTVLLVPGYLNTRQTKFVDLFAPQKRMLERLKIPYKFLTYPEAGSVKNAHVLSEDILAAPGPVVIISHSEGSALTLKTALIDGDFGDMVKQGAGEQSWPALKEICGRMGERYTNCAYPPSLGNTAPLREKLIGWISLNGNFGTPLADKLTDTENPGPLSRIVQRFLHRRAVDSMLSLVQMTQPVIRGYLTDNEQSIKDLNARLPIISFASWFEREPDGEAGVLGARQGFSDFIIKHVDEAGYPASDSIVPVQHQIVPDSQYVIAGNVPHYMTVKDYNRLWFLRFTKGRELVPTTDATAVLLDMLGARIRDQREDDQHE